MLICESLKKNPPCTDQKGTNGVDLLKGHSQTCLLIFPVNVFPQFFLVCPVYESMLFYYVLEIRYLLFLS